MTAHFSLFLSNKKVCAQTLGCTRTLKTVFICLRFYTYCGNNRDVYFYTHFNFCLLCMPVTAFDTVKFHFWGAPHQQHWHWTRYPHLFLFSLNLDNPLCILYCICILPPGAVLPLQGVSESLVTWKHMIEHISIGRMEFHPNPAQIMAGFSTQTLWTSLSFHSTSKLRKSLRSEYQGIYY